MFKDSFRLFKILNTLLKARLDKELETFTKPKIISFLLFISPWRLYSSEKESGERLRLALEDLGPIFIKFGQLLSTRPDVVPGEIAKSLKTLQDDLPHFSDKEAISIIEKELGSNISSNFEDFNPSPLAAASIAQVYSAKLRANQKKVVIKVVRPGIKKTIQRDISLMKRIASFSERRFEDAKRLQLSKLVAEYEAVILSELDMRLEASNIKQTARNFEDNNLLYVPEVYLDYCSENLLVMEMIEGIPVDRIETLNDLGVDLKLVAERGVEIFLKQVFIDNFFHADMHPGNIFIDAKNPSDPAYVAVDYAIVGSLSEEEQYQIGRMLVAVIGRDFREVANILIESKWVNPETRINDLENTIRAACEPIFDQPMEKINFGEMLLFIFDSARRFDLRMQPSLMLLQKTLVNIEGLGKQLYPALDFWSIANPFLKNWISERYNPKKLADWAKRNSLSWLEKARKFPDIAETAIEQVSKMEEYQNANEERHKQLMNKIYEQGKLNRVLLLGFIILILFLIID
jgi:ubiquinone biosynthesis protein